MPRQPGQLPLASQSVPGILFPSQFENMRPCPGRNLKMFQDDQFKTQGKCPEIFPGFGIGRKHDSHHLFKAQPCPLGSPLKFAPSHNKPSWPPYLLVLRHRGIRPPIAISNHALLAPHRSWIPGKISRDFPLGLESAVTILHLT